MKYVDKLYLKPVGGLCNRLRAIGSAAQIAADAKKRLVVFWGRDVHLNCKFSDLFVQSPYFDVIEEKQWKARKSLFPYLPGTVPTTTLRKLTHWATCQKLSIKRFVWFEDLEQTVAPLVKNVNPDVVKSMKAFEESSYPYIIELLKPIYLPGSAFICSAWKFTAWQNYKDFFVPIPAIQDQIDILTIDFNHTIGVHIRRSDHTSATTFSQLSRFELAMQQELHSNPKTNFFLATDCKRSEQHLMNKFGEKVRIYKKNTLDRNTTIGIQESVVDLYTLANTKKILGSYFSSFSQVAAEINGIKEKTIL